MAHINGRFHEVQAWGGESEALPPAPDYVFQIEAVEQGQSPQKATPQLNVTCLVLNEGELYGRKAIFRYNLNFEGKGGDTARKRLKSLIDATQIPLDDQGGINDDDLIGRVLMADVIQETYKVADATTGTQIEKIATRIQNERVVPDANAQAGAPAPAAAAPAPAAAPAAAAPAPAARAAAPAPAARPAPAAPAARPAYAPPGRGAPAGVTRVQ
jgi:hypothetical protein